jgi:hypothetical protein
MLAALEQAGGATRSQRPLLQPCWVVVRLLRLSVATSTKSGRGVAGPLNHLQGANFSLI